jgi:NAD(P)-dependent dehydrogenase (short-subunit alcohol dehydrogenase family)
MAYGDSGSSSPVAVVTGASRGLGRALAAALAERGWQVLIDGRDRATLAAAAAELGGAVSAISGDVSDEGHRRALIDAAARHGRLDLLINNASVLGPSPQPLLGDYPMETLEDVYRVNVFAPVRLVQLALPLLQSSGGRVINVTSDAALQPYEGWGGYGSSKAALEQISNVLSAEHPDLKIYWVDPGDMNTQMHQEAFPGEDISDRPAPEMSVPGFLRLIEGDEPSGRYEARALVPDPA